MAIRSSVRTAAKIGTTAACAILFTAGMALPAQATSASSSWNIPGGNKLEVNAWHCGLFAKACDWKASTKMKGTKPKSAQWIQNRAEIKAHGIGAKVTISKNPSAVLKMKSKSMGEVRLKNTKTWIADTSGQIRPTGAPGYVSTKSCGSAQVTSKIKVSEKCVTAGAF